MRQQAVTLLEKISGDWSIAGIGHQVDRLRVFQIGNVPPGSLVRIDCSSIEEIDSCGFQLLSAWCHFIREKGLKGKLINMPYEMRKMQVQLGLDVDHII